MGRSSYTTFLGVALGLFTLALMAGPAEAINLRDWGKQTGNNRFKVLNDFNGEGVLDKETQLV